MYYFFNGDNQYINFAIVYLRYLFPKKLPHSK
jgi:hypothetical protein